MKRFLITTALEETWREGEAVLFLGEWCRLHSRKDRWSRMDAEVLPYHWDDRAKLYADFQYLRGLNERLLWCLAEQLNRLHGVDRGLRYWRILIGPWLGYFIQMLFDRWCSIQKAVAQHDLSETIVFKGMEEALVPSGMAHFEDLCMGDEWNHLLYADILERHTSVPCIRRRRECCHGKACSGRPKAAATWGVRTKRALAAWYSYVASISTGDRDAFFLATYLPIREEMRMYRRLGQVPQLWRSPMPPRAPVDWRRRQWVVAGDSACEFEECARAMIPRHLPTVYLEGYSKLVDQTARLPWPKHPKIVWTSNSFSSDDVFKAWAAQKVEEGSPLAIGQHGGTYGVGRWMFVEDHEIAISDCYLSWGWVEPDKPKVKPVGALKSRRPLGVQHEVQPGALLVTVTMPRQSYHMSSTIVSGQWLDYFGDQVAFVETLPPAIRAVLTVRLYPEDYGWGQIARWREHFPDIRLDQGERNIDELIRQCRIYISTYNATTFLESFTMDVPTVIYWDPAHWELRDSAVSYFEDLKAVGIFHDTPQSAARHVAEIWDNVGIWWRSPAVRGARERFMARYCHLPHDLLHRVEAALREAMKHGNSDPRGERCRQC